jgi:cytosine/adenosine deaminase-related metal-dependent hydrolase
VNLFLADWIAPIDGPILRCAGIAISGGTIIALAPADPLRNQFPTAPVEDLGHAVLLPGLVNPHVHLELSALSPGQRPASFVDWLKRGVPRTPPGPDEIRAFVERSIDIGVRQCLQFGVTSVGDISRQCAITRPLLKSGPLRVVSYGEVVAMAQRRGLLEERIAIAAGSAGNDASDWLRIGISPHAPYSVEPDGFRRCLEVARASGLPLATHLAETRDEMTFLAEHCGPFRELWDYLDAWDEQVPKFTGGPIRLAAAMGLLDYPSLLAHVNYCDDEELAILAVGAASVVYCPRTHAYFGHPPHRWRDMLAAGINVAVGTDSCASSPDLNIVDDLRLLHKIAPEVPVEQLWEMATVRAARAIGADDRVGSITVGKRADFVAFSLSGDDPMREVLESQLLPSQVWTEGMSASGEKPCTVAAGPKLPLSAIK